MLKRQLPRLVAIVCCVILLGSLFVLGGADWPQNPEAGPGVDIEEPTVTPEFNPGAFVDTSGIVVSTNPVVIEIETADGGTTYLELANAPNVETGQHVDVTGTLTEDGTLDVSRERAVVREPWEIVYMYLISVVGALLVVGIGVNSWRLDLQRLSVEPRERPLHEAYTDRAGGKTDG